MKKHFIVSLIKNGILGGKIVADSEAMTYRTGKLTVPQEFRNLVMKYAEICEVTAGWYFVLPTVMVKMKNGNAYKFVVFFSRKSFIETLESRGIGK